MATRKINTRRLVYDIRFGMIDPYIRIKHRLSSTTLRTLFGGLYREKDVTPSRLYETSRIHGKGIGDIPVKRTPRTETMDDPPVPMYDVEFSTEVTSISQLLELPGPRPLAPTPIRGSPGWGLRQDSQDHYRDVSWN